MDAQALVYYRARLAEVDAMLASKPADWRNHLSTIQGIMARIDHFPISTYRDMIDDYVHFIHIVQRFAYHDTDQGAIREVASWCKQQWLNILEVSPYKVAALSGAAKNWLLQAQPFLARIHRKSRNTSAGESGSSSTFFHDYSRSEDAEDDANDILRAESRLQTADYVEARGILLPATDLYNRAVAAAKHQGAVTGDLLVSAAEAHMSLGNVTSIKHNEAYFRQALHYLREASQLPGYKLEPFLQQYLDEYGRLM